MKGLTIDEIAQTLAITPKTAHKRLERAGIKPISYKAQYDPSAVDAIRTTSKGGRPKKPADPKPNEPSKKASKRSKQG